jgi:hypothetical protein
MPSHSVPKQRPPLGSHVKAGVKQRHVPIEQPSRHTRHHHYCSSLHARRQLRPSLDTTKGTKPYAPVQKGSGLATPRAQEKLFKHNATHGKGRKRAPTSSFKKAGPQHKQRLPWTDSSSPHQAPALSLRRKVPKSEQLRKVLPTQSGLVFRSPPPLSNSRNSRAPLGPLALFWPALLSVSHPQLFHLSKRHKNSFSKGNNNNTCRFLLGLSTTSR